MREITSISEACAGQTVIQIRFDLSGRLKELIQNLMGEGFDLWIDGQGNISGKLEGSYEEIARLLELLKISGFKS